MNTTDQHLADKTSKIEHAMTLSARVEEYNGSLVIARTGFLHGNPMYPKTSVESAEFRLAEVRRDLRDFLVLAIDGDVA